MCACPNTGLQNKIRPLFLFGLYYFLLGKTYFFIRRFTKGWIYFHFFTWPREVNHEFITILTVPHIWLQGPIGSNIEPWWMFGCLYLFYDNVNLSIPWVNMRNIKCWANLFLQKKVNRNLHSNLKLHISLQFG